MSVKPFPSVRLLRENETIVLSESLARSVGFFGMDPWSRFAHNIYGFPVYRFVSQRNHEVTGWLALAHIRHPFFGNYLATSPFGSYGGFAFSSLAARDALLDKAWALARELGAEHVNIRFEAGEQTPPEGWIQHPIYATYYVDLQPDLDRMMAAYGSDHRNHIRKSLKKGFSVKFGHLDLLEHVYEGLVRSMHELGSPYHSKLYLRTMLELLSDDVEFAVLFGPHAERVGAGVFTFQGDLVTNLHANILRRFRSDYAGEFLYWSAIERYSQKDYKVFDLGRSLMGSGNERFKMKWRPRRQILAYWYALMPGHSLPELNQKSPKFQAAIWLWKHMPAFFVRFLGPFLIRGVA